MIRTIFYLSWVLLLLDIPCILYGQNSDLTSRRVPAASASGMSKVVDVPVDLHTGIPNLSIPITEIDISGFNLPISIGYIASGLKTEDVSSNVGAGWVLRAGGQLNKLTVKYPDEGIEANFPLNDGLTQITDGFNNVLIPNPLNKKNWKYQNDLPDVYRAVAPGLDCRFSGVQTIAPKKRIKIVRTATDRFILTNTEGIQYTYSLAEDSSLNHLTQIELPNGRKVLFEYESFTVDMPGVNMKETYYQIQGTELSDFADDGLEGASSSTTRRSYRLKKIIFSGGYIDFVYEKERMDLLGASMLTAIRRYDKVDAIYYKRTIDLKLHQSYFISGVTDPEQNKGSSEKFRYLFYHLRLDSLSFIGYSGSQTYGFKYDGTTLPLQNSLSQDHWGYYNGQDNHSLIRSFIRKDGSMSSYSNRESNAAFAQAGILKEITYPTGAKQIFEYELNSTETQFPGYSSTFNVPWSNHKGVKIHPIPIISSPVSPERFSGFNLEIRGGGASPGEESVSFQISTKKRMAGHPVYVSLSIVPLSIAGDANRIRLDTIVTMSGTGVFGSVVFDKILPIGLYRILCGKLDRDGINYGVQDGDLFIPAELKVITGTYSPVVQPTTGLAYQYPAGGLRIKKITLSDGKSTDQVQTFSYQQFLSPARSSGSFGALPDYIETTSEIYIPTKQLAYQASVEKVYVLSSTSYRDFIYIPKLPVKIDDAEETVVYFNAFKPVLLQHDNPVFSYYLEYEPRQFDVRQASNNKVSSRLVESYVGYSNVTVDYGGNGKRELTYSNSGEAWQRGLLLSEKIYSMKDGNYVAIAESNNSYTIDNNGYVLASTVKTSFSAIPGTPAVSERQEYNYRHTNFSEPSRIVRISSEGDSSVTERRYVIDFPGLGQGNDLSKGIANLFSKNMLSTVVEQISYQRSSLGTRTGMHSEFTEFLPGQPVTRRILTTDGIADPSSFQLAKVTAGNLVRNNGYRSLLEFTKHDFTGNVLEQRSTSGVLQATIWNRDGTLVIAEAQNAAVDDIFYESFEEILGTIDPQAKGGEKCYIGNYKITFAPISLRTDLRISYWSYSSGKWSLNKALYSNGMTLTGDKIDEIRIYPPEAELRSFTYGAGGRMLSSSDTGDKYTYYDYDDRGNLIAIRDDDRNIREVYQQRPKWSTLY